jgi:RimJ/RimL family protein N-acetyltransferase
MPAHPPGFLTIFYVGVVPEMRGRGHVDGLLAAGTTTLLPARDGNDAPLRADTDVYNAPMSAAFERAGWTRFALRREYAAALEPTHDDEWIPPSPFSRGSRPAEKSFERRRVCEHGVAGEPQQL